MRKKDTGSCEDCGQPTSPTNCLSSGGHVSMHVCLDCLTVRINSPAALAAMIAEDEAVEQAIEEVDGFLDQGGRLS
jgi:hypothetical protein